MDNEIEQELWDRHVAWSMVADRQKRFRTRARAWVLFLTIAGAALQTLSVQAGMAAGIAGTICLTVVPAIAAAWLRPEQTKKWLRARSISEGIKSEYHLYRAKAAPYDAANPLETLHDKVKEIGEWGADMANLLAAVGRRGATPPDIAPDTYIKNRVVEQIETFYEPKAHDNARIAESFRYTEIVLTIMTAILSAIATYTMKTRAATGIAVPVGPWIAVLTTIGGTIAAFAAAGRYDFQATTYFATAANLKDLITGWQLKKCPPPPDPEWSRFVNDCEATISAENRGWMAKLDDSQKPQI